MKKSHERYRIIKSDKFIIIIDHFKFDIEDYKENIYNCTKKTKGVVFFREINDSNVQEISKEADDYLKEISSILKMKDEKDIRRLNMEFPIGVSIIILFYCILMIFLSDGHIKSDETKYYSKSMPIYFFNSEENVTGNVILGSGGISSERKYVFYLKKDSTYEIKSLNAGSTFIREMDTIPSVKWFYKVQTKTSYIPIFNKVDTTRFLMEKKYNPIITIPKEMLFKLQNNN